MYLPSVSHPESLFDYMDDHCLKFYNRTTVVTVGENC